MTQHNKDIMNLIKDIRVKLAEYGPKSRQGRELYNSLITIYSMLDVTNEPELKDNTNMKEFDLANEYLAELLNREPTRREVEEFMEEQESKAYDLKEAEMKGN